MKRKDEPEGRGSEDEVSLLRRDLEAARRLLELEVQERRRAELSFRLNEDRLDALLKLSEMRESSIEELAQYAIDEAVRLTGSAIGYIHLVNQAQDGFSSYFWSKGSREVCAAVETMDYSIVHAGIWADSLRLARPVIHNDYPSEPTRRGLPQGHLALTRHMGVPVLAGARVVAVGGVANKPSPYDGADLRQLLLFTRRLWAIIDARRAEEALVDANAELSRLASLDGLTGIANRRALDQFFELQWRAAIREESEVSLLMIDIDCFKDFNDRYGHLEGDTTLKLVAGAVARAARRPTDLAARYGGEEFALVLARTSAEKAFAIARALVSEVAGLGIVHEREGGPGVVMVSIGVASAAPCREGGQDFEGLVAAADAALYEAKRQGKGRAALAASL